MKYLNDATDITDGENLFFKGISTGEIVAGNETGLANLVSFKTIPFLKGYYGENMSDDWVACDNPFGKNLRFTLYDMDHQTLYSCGSVAVERIIIEMEFKLLPENKIN